MKSVITFLFIIILIQPTYAFDSDSLERAFEKYPPGSSDLPGVPSNPEATERLRALELNFWVGPPERLEYSIESEFPVFPGSASFSPEVEKGLSNSIYETLPNQIISLDSEIRGLQHEIASLREMIFDLEYALRLRHNPTNEWDLDHREDKHGVDNPNKRGR